MCVGFWTLLFRSGYKVMHRFTFRMQAPSGRKTVLLLIDGYNKKYPVPVDTVITFPNKFFSHHASQIEIFKCICSQWLSWSHSKQRNAFLRKWLLLNLPDNGKCVEGQLACFSDIHCLSRHWVLLFHYFGVGLAMYTSYSYSY